MHAFSTHNLGFTWCPFGGETGGGTEAALSTTPAQKRSLMRLWLMICLPHRFAGLRESAVQTLVRTLAEAYSPPETTASVAYGCLADAYGREVVAYGVSR